MCLIELLGVALVVLLTYGIVYGLVVACCGMAGLQLLKALALPIVCGIIFYGARYIDRKREKRNKNGTKKKD